MAMLLGREQFGESLMREFKHEPSGNSTAPVDDSAAVEEILPRHIAGGGAQAVRALQAMGLAERRHHDTSANALPLPLIELIYEFLRLSSFPKLQTVCPRFHRGLSGLLARNPDLARHLEEHLNAQDVVQKRVWVAVRVKPTEDDAKRCLTVKHRLVKCQGDDTSFIFDGAFDSNATQRDVWSKVCPSIMKSLLEEQHVCFLAYGQTGSGKTHTMFGDRDVPEGAGVAFRALRSLSRMLRSTQARDRGMEPSVEFSFLEVYNEKVYDLLNEQKQVELVVEREVKKAATKYHSAEYSKKKNVVPKGLTRRQCDLDRLDEQVGDWMDEGAATRTVGKTVFNARSSRSHAVATLHIKFTEGEKETRLYLVDLAGSERAGQYALSDEQLKEGVNINKSLSTMARVITVLASGAAEHVPYRDSTLTWLLSDSITGINARTFMIAALNPLHNAESLSTLRYAQQYSSLQSNQEEINKIGSSVRKSLAQVQSVKHEFKFLLKETDFTRATLKAAMLQNPRGQTLQIQKCFQVLRDLEIAEEKHADKQKLLKEAQEKNKQREAKLTQED
mmetsp:Transcript_81651/g.141957  ORF Transcript_81651/g.141957 Transcript_81651/m.141957 type:complete len:561 (+) Transcript_81651:68-1750(+)